MKITNRLATLELTSGRPSRGRPRHKKGLQRNAKKSNKFIELPMDIVFEISVLLHPLDLLRLSRVSKSVRSVYMSRQAQTIWRAVLNRVEPELPPCAPDLNEAQYASLLFESSCSACGYVEATKMYSLRLRLCGCCRKENILTGYQLTEACKCLPDDVYSLVPRLLFSTYLGSNSCYNSDKHMYYKAEFEMVIDRYLSLQHRKKSLKAFIGERKLMSSDIMQHGCELISWDASFRNHQRRLSYEREKSVRKKLEEVGWDPLGFPDSGDGAQHERWIKLMNIPEPLTDESWKSISPKLERILLQTREKRRIYALQINASFQYCDFLRHLSPLDRATMPHWPEARTLPSIAGVLSRRQQDISTTPGRPFWDSLFKTAQSETTLYSTAVKKVLVRLLKYASPHPFPSSANMDEVLNHARSVFQCKHKRCCHPSAQSFNYPDILTHITESSLQSSWSRDWVACDPGVMKISFLMLKRSNLPVDTPRVTIQNLDGKLICLCGHPDHRKPTSFNKLVDHVVNENKWFNRLRDSAMKSTAKSSIDSELFNDHDMEGDYPVFAIGSQDMKAASAVGAISRRNLDEFFLHRGGVPRVVGYCVACYGLSGLFIDFTNEEKMLYHMKAKHRIRILKKADFDAKGSLMASQSGNKTDVNYSLLL